MASHAATANLPAEAINQCGKQCAGSLTKGSATQQNRVRDYIIFAILPRLHPRHADIIHAELSETPHGHLAGIEF